MQNYKRQSGFLSWEWVMLIVVFGFVLMVAGKLGPHYLDNHYIKVALKALAKENPKLEEMTKSQIERELSDFMRINGVRGKEASAFKIHRRSDRVIIDNIYEVREPFFLNIDVVLSFKTQLNSATPEVCCQYRIEAVNED